MTPSPVAVPAPLEPCVTGRDRSTVPVDRIVLLLGCPNVGKTTLFNRICREDSRVANFPGSTVAIGRGSTRIADATYRLIDPPGIDTSVPESEDERISRLILLEEGPDVIALVADGRNLRKSLLLASEIAEYGIPTLLDVNVMDEARQRGVQIDDDELASRLGVPVTLTVATEGEGVDDLVEAFPEARPPIALAAYPAAVESGLALIARLLGPSVPCARALGTALLSGNREARDHLAAKCGPEISDEIDGIVRTVQTSFNRPLSAVIIEARLLAVDRILGRVLTTASPAQVPFSETIGRWTRQPLTGYPIAGLVVVLMYLFVGRWGAGTLVELFEHRLFEQRIVPAVQQLVAGVQPAWIQEMLVGKFGLVSLGLKLSLGVVIPVLVIFFFAFAVLEDSGYLPRLSVLFDRAARRIGLNGKAVLPLSMGFSCVTMGILTARILETARERFIANLLLILGVPCGPVLVVMLATLSGMPASAALTVFGVLAAQIVVIGHVAHRLLPREPADFILELPPIRVPKLGSLVSKTFARTRRFVVEALPFFLATTFALFVLDALGGLALIERVGTPVLTGLLGLPPRSIEVVVMSLLRKDVAAALLKGFADQGLFDHVQVVVTLLLICFLTPCVNAIIVMIRDRGPRLAVAMMCCVAAYALLVGAVVNAACRILGVTFR